MAAISMHDKGECIELPLGNANINWIDYETNEMGITYLNSFSNVLDLLDVYEYLNKRRK